MDFHFAIALKKAAQRIGNLLEFHKTSIHQRTKRQCDRPSPRGSGLPTLQNVRRLVGQAVPRYFAKLYQRRPFRRGKFLYESVSSRAAQ
jgi:hypothetical protein